MSDLLTRIKRAVLSGRYVFSEKASIEREAAGITELDVVESIANAVAICKTLRSTHPTEHGERQTPADDPSHVVDKYGNHIHERSPPNTDRRDIGLAELPDLKYEAFYILGTSEANERYEMEPSCNRLGWRPMYDFTWMPTPMAKE